MACLLSLPTAALWEQRLPTSQVASSFVDNTLGRSSSKLLLRRKAAATRAARIRAFCWPLEDQPIIKDALKEPVAFMGGVFAGLLRLDLNEDPLKEWISKTVEDSGIAEEGETQAKESNQVGDDTMPQQIDIE